MFTKETLEEIIAKAQANIELFKNESAEHQRKIIEVNETIPSLSKAVTDAQNELAQAMGARERAQRRITDIRKEISLEQKEIRENETLYLQAETVAQKIAKEEAQQERVRKSRSSPHYDRAAAEDINRMERLLGRALVGVPGAIRSKFEEQRRTYFPTLEELTHDLKLNKEALDEANKKLRNAESKLEDAHLNEKFGANSAKGIHFSDTIRQCKKDIHELTQHRETLLEQSKTAENSEQQQKRLDHEMKHITNDEELLRYITSKQKKINSDALRESYGGSYKAFAGMKK